MLTARDGSRTAWRASTAATDDYLLKPFAFEELLARLRAIIRRGPVERALVLEVGDLRLHPGTRRAWRGEAPVTLSSTEFSMLEAFMRRPGCVLSRVQLLEEVWRANERGSNVVDV